MNQDPVLFNMPSHLLYRDEAVALYRQLQNLEDSSLPLTHDIRNGVLADVISGLSTNNSSGVSVQDLEKTVAAWIHDEDDVVHIITPTLPSDEFVSRVVSWFRANVSVGTLAVVTVDKDMIAGCDIRYRSHVYKMSISDDETSTSRLLFDGIRKTLP